MITAQQDLNNSDRETNFFIFYYRSCSTLNENKQYKKKKRKKKKQFLSEFHQSNYWKLFPNSKRKKDFSTILILELNIKVS